MTNKSGYTGDALIAYNKGYQAGYGAGYEDGWVDGYGAAHEEENDG